MKTATIMTALGLAALAAAAPTTKTTPRTEAGSFSGQLTYYQVGLGACGTDSSGKDWTDNIAALNVEQMGDLSNGNPYCGRQVAITANGKTTTATILDKCMGCAYGDLDVSQKAFSELYDLDVGRGEITWTFI